MFNGLLSMVFVDTGVWFASLAEEDPRHAECRRLLIASSVDPLTTDWVVDELIALLTARGHHDLALRHGDRFWSEQTALLHRVEPDDVQAAWRVFASHTDKRWSFTDCTSHAVMQRLGITEALALDDHFRQFGFCEVWP